ncbi:hypothetical protein A2962_04200 [Candidatus Woesebacteria bacterium RIFCSPLOWO2_01_FULL_39_61]|uniref:DUF433 domain-containing protein n=3 Tax=Candidatus Woeseibacteriota TaxID=1752722 RepID=A0A0G0NEF7_9BACT|nr:MAG: hypothetical protein US72_C0003G0061 [Microgenomates group bacterium GW2011_GWC1_38_12]KKQ94486.1 MAG: hypothetical protein UT19_C0001G0018 [Candidatus Woesebacteria bacterium GW2011_GWB1_39_10b]KKR13883.1 MAG: hypothetical protein UT40_C0008G0007 [Candidatus Woesebacteria bacterium GW2011_GWA1_39_21b]OGM32164.1 MAG: hypothetical protein A3D01_02140 [Candidatus Woesebacteria bacterium RIFCSPHIGHO2_02_FULL_39_13]OGM36541.1 MAG: hypothetical protein A3E13_04295 [Candidatus Woesebacteria b
MAIKRIFQNITLDPKVRFGKPVIEGTRVPVDLIVGKVGGGMTIEEVMEEYGLTKGQVLNALRYAAKVVANEEIALA